jgi:YidC/Oxa1 family membrane protein insertase
MEKRLLLAIVLSFLVLFLYQLVFVKKQPSQEPPPEIPAEMQKSPQKKPVPEQSLESIEKSMAAEAQEESFQPVSEEREEQIIVDTPLYRAVWTNSGAQLKSWKLKKYQDENNEDLELISSRSAVLNRYPFLLNSGDTEFDDLINGALYKSSSQRLQLQEGQQEALRFEYATEDGTKVEKIFAFEGGTYDFGVRINAWKQGRKIEPRIVWGPDFGNLTPQELKQRIGGSSPGISVYAGEKVARLEERKYSPEKGYYNFAEWVAYDINYFAALFIAPPQMMSAAFLREEINQTPYFFLVMDLPEKAYIGPKDIDQLSKLGHNAKKLIRFGLFGWIAEIMLRAIKYIHESIPNWGFCIIILTIIIKILFFPLTYSSTKSMAKMQELQPKMKAIRAKYKKAKQDIAQRRKMNEEIMKLYKEHGVNPAGGCLPILIQLPIFWGFFQMLRTSIEFRDSPFILWIRDLSVKDPYYVTPILMGVTQYINQKMTPTSADPTQQKMMLIMPVVMTLFFMNFSSGLVLYWLTNNVLQIGQQYIMNRLRQKKKSETHGKKRRKK